MLIFLLCCGRADAAEWAIVHTAPEGDQYFYDATRLSVSGNEVTYWKKVIFRSPYAYKGKPAASALYRERIHCVEHTVKPLSYIVHGVSGAVIEHVATEGEAAPIVPETIGDVFEQVLCAQAALRREEEARKAAQEKETLAAKPVLPEGAKVEPAAPQPYNGGEPSSPPPPPGTL
jgi:hypothetical protein